MNDKFDVIIIGGSYAGLSAALALGRALRKVLLIDSGKPCNRFTSHSHNFLTHDGHEPDAIAMQGKTDLQQYKTVDIYEDMATTAINTGDGFTIQTASGQQFQARKLVLATGLKDILPEIKGFEACWGKSVIHCPYCHGYEYAHKATAILDNGDAGYHYVEMISNWTKDLVVFTDGPSSFNDQQLAKIKKHKIRIIETPVEAIEHENGQVQQVRTKDGLSFSVSAIYNKPKNVQHSDIPESLGCEITEQGLIKVDEMRQTTVKGVFACGDNSSMRSVATAVFTGSFTGVTVNNALIEEDF